MRSGASHVSIGQTQAANAPDLFRLRVRDSAFTLTEQLEWEKCIEWEDVEDRAEYVSLL